jgi:hypothetical protein
MKTGMLKCWFAVSVLGILTGCGGKPISKSDLPGKYVADFGFATDTLNINPDGGYTQTIKIKSSGKTAAANGTWRFDPKDRDIHFSEFMVVINGFSEMVTNFDAPTNRSSQIATVRQRMGKLEIGGDDSPWGRKGVETPYTKQPGP